MTKRHVITGYIQDIYHTEDLNHCFDGYFVYVLGQLFMFQSSHSRVDQYESVSVDNCECSLRRDLLKVDLLKKE